MRTSKASRSNFLYRESSPVPLPEDLLVHAGFSNRSDGVSDTTNIISAYFTPEASEERIALAMSALMVWSARTCAATSAS
jgi:hypothetical protein